MSLRRTPFYECHVAAGGRLIDFGGWELPVWYSSITAEHRAVRTGVGLFDVSHMGEVRVRGPRALEAVRHLVTNNVDLVDGAAQYTALCQPDGGIVDDLIVYRLAADDVLICVNAANRDKDFAHLVAHNPLPDEVQITDEGDAWGQLAVQGRRAAAIVAELAGRSLDDVRNYHFVQGSVAGIDGCIVARTGYTGEDGFEIFVPSAQAEPLWHALLEVGADEGIVPVGLGARDSLRLEAAMCLYGNDIDETTTPLEARLGWVVDWDKPDFVGKAALVAQREQGVKRRLVGLEVDKRIPRPHCPILSDGEPVGEVTSGTKAPWLERNIALGYVPRRLARPGTALQVDVRGRIAEARVVRLPFFRRDYTP